MIASLDALVVIPLPSIPLPFPQLPDPEGDDTVPVSEDSTSGAVAWKGGAGVGPGRWMGEPRHGSF